MVRIKRGKISHKKHKKILRLSKGYYSSRSRTYRSSYQAVIKSGQYSYRDRKQKKRNFRKLWIIQINSKVREYGISYSKFIKKLNDINLKINRKILADIINNNPYLFEKIMLLIKKNNLLNNV